jgi:hypothetical protein
MTITLTREEVQQVLEHLDDIPHFHNAVIETLRARLSAPEPEPDKYLMEVECTKCGAKQDGILTVNAPQQRNWQRLTEQDFSAINQSCSTKLQAATSAESILKEKNT